MKWGPEPIGGGRWRFCLWAPGCEHVTLEFDGQDPIVMCLDEGWFAVETEASPGTRYRFRLGDGQAVPDPASRAQSGGVHGWSVVTDPLAYRWRCVDWRGRPWEEAVILEVHPGVLGGFAGVTELLPTFADLSVTAIELMPVAAFSGERNWGYDGVLPYAVAESYGHPDDLKGLVDRAHQLGLMILLDVVYNHFGPDGNYLGTYAPDFFDHHAQTPWGVAVAISRTPVQRFFIDNALMWLGEFRLDGLRFDAVHAIGDDTFLDAMAREIRSAFPDRAIHLVLENERNDADRLASGRYDAQWNDDFHNVLHVLLTGENEGYYRAFAEDTTRLLARCLADGFIYQGEVIPGSDQRRGKPSGHLPATAFVSFLQNHDQVGNRAMGERLIDLVDPPRLRVAVALLLLCPQIPMLFMGEESGSRSPFLFFTDFHDELADAVREGRRREFARFAAFSDPAARAQIPDPNALATFQASVPRPGTDAEAWRAFYARLIAVRRDHIVPRLVGARGLDARVLTEGAVAARWRMGDGATLTIALNIGDKPSTFPQTEGTALFNLDEAGKPASFAAWITT